MAGSVREKTGGNASLPCTGSDGFGRERVTQVPVVKSKLEQTSSTTAGRYRQRMACSAIPALGDEPRKARGSTSSLAALHLTRLDFSFNSELDFRTLLQLPTERQPRRLGLLSPHLVPCRSALSPSFLSPGLAAPHHSPDPWTRHTDPCGPGTRTPHCRKTRPAALSAVALRSPGPLTTSVDRHRLAGMSESQSPGSSHDDGGPPKKRGELFRCRTVARALEDGGRPNARCSPSVWQRGNRQGAGRGGSLAWRAPKG